MLPLLSSVEPVFMSPLTGLGNANHILFPTAGRRGLNYRAPFAACAIPRPLILSPYASQEWRGVVRN
jgi:hypothetical protein